MIKVFISSFCFVAAFGKMNISYMLQCTKFSLTFRPQNHTLYPWTACECISYRAVARLQNKTRQVSGLAEMLFEAFSVAFVLRKVNLFMAMEIQVVVLNVTLLSSIICLQVLVYKEARRHEKRILALQASDENKARFKREKKALKLTTFTIVTILLFFILPIAVLYITWVLYGEKFSNSEKTTLRHFVLGLVVLQSTVNPIIRTCRNRQFLVAFIELLWRKGFREAEEMARNLCSRSRRSTGRPEAGQDREMMELNCNQFELPGRVSHGNTIRGV